MKKQISFRLIALLLAIPLLFIGVFLIHGHTALKEAEADDSYHPSNEEFDAYAMEAAKRYLTITSGSTNGYLTQGFEIHKESDTDNRVYFVFKGDECIAKMVVSYGGEFNSSYAYGAPYPVISEAYRIQERFYFYCGVCDDLWYCGENTYVQITGPQYNDELRTAIISAIMDNAFPYDNVIELHEISSQTQNRAGVGA